MEADVKEDESGVLDAVSREVVKAFKKGSKAAENGVVNGNSKVLDGPNYNTTMITALDLYIGIMAMRYVLS